MEGKSLSSLRSCVLAAVLLALLRCSAYAQTSGDTTELRTPFEHAGAFLEPNRFVTGKELGDRSLWLEAGYGRSLLRIADVHLGLEALIWSRLNALSGFRFPVLTADYFFGAYGETSLGSGVARVRVSHISSHRVDGEDSAVIGGASSRYSREFVEMCYTAMLLPDDGLQFIGGVRAIFHQVTCIEPTVSFPCLLDWCAAGEASMPDESANSLHLVLSSEIGPVWPCVGGGIRFRHRNEGTGYTNVDVLYHTGASWSGTDAAAHQDGLEVQLSISD